MGVCAGLNRIAPVMVSRSPKGGDEFRQPLRRTVAQMRRDLQDRHGEHRVGEPNAQDRRHELGATIKRGQAPGHLAAQRGIQRNAGIEMRPRQRREDRDQNHQRRAGGQGIGQKGDGAVSAGQPLGHDARADHRGPAAGRCQGIRRPGDASCLLADLRHFRCNDRWSRLEIFRAAKAVMRLASPP